MKKIIKKVLPFYSWIYRKISAKILDDGHLFYSQDGEDCVMGYFFQTNKNGFYVDVGAHHPKYLSNTYRAYKIGWSGINIDPMPGFAEKFKKFRPRDICLEMGVSKTQDRLSYYSFETPEMNTFSEEEANESLSEGNKLLAKIDIDTLPLSSILDQSLPEGKNIDFLSVDVEGFDMIVLESNNWDKYLPRAIAIEEMRYTAIEDIIKESEIYKYLASKGYSLFYRTKYTSVYMLGGIGSNQQKFIQKK